MISSSFSVTFGTIWDDGMMCKYANGTGNLLLSFEGHSELMWYLQTIFFFWIVINFLLVFYRSLLVNIWNVNKTYPVYSSLLFTLTLLNCYGKLIYYNSTKLISILININVSAFTTSYIKSIPPTSAGSIVWSRSWPSLLISDVVSLLEDFQLRYAYLRCSLLVWPFFLSYSCWYCWETQFSALH